MGMRYLFPQLGEELQLYERAQIWVARHDHKYFVGYTAEQLAEIDPKLRPLAPITSELYKLHMNRWGTETVSFENSFLLTSGFSLGRKKAINACGIVGPNAEASSGISVVEK